jgi:hypothetical protein
MQSQTGPLQKSVKILDVFPRNFAEPDFAHLCTVDTVRTYNMSTDQPHTSNNAEENYTGKYMEQHTSLRKQENYLLSHWHLQGTWQLTVPQGLIETQPSKPLHYAWPHKYRFKKQAVIQYVSSPI